MAAEFHLEDIGATLTLTISDDDGIVNLSGATTNFIFKRPDNTTTTKAATLVTDGTDGQVKYVVESGVFNQIGIYSLQAAITIGATAFKSQIQTFRVHRNL